MIRKQIGRRNRDSLRMAARRRIFLEGLEDRELLSGEGIGATYLPRQHDLFIYGGYLSGPSNDSPLTVAENYLRAHAPDLGLVADDLDYFQITTNYTTTATGITTLTFEQTLNGLPVEHANFNISVMADGRLLEVTGGFVPGLIDRAADIPTIPAMSSSDAVIAAAAALNLSLSGLMMPVDSDGDGDPEWRASAISLDDITTVVKYVAIPGDDVSLAWNLTLRTPDGAHWYSVSIDSNSGAMVAVADYTDDASYEVYGLPTADPQDHPRTIVADPHLINPSPTVVPSPFGWHDTNGATGAEFTITRGNNVNAYADRNADNLADAGSQPDGGASLNFTGALVPVNFTQAPSTYTAAAVTNLFYLNNVLHDLHYLYGFDEASRNFQVNNYGRGGTGNDAVNAEAQDGTGTNNANFNTPPDGSAPRMQMYEFVSTSPRRDGDFDAEIVIHEYGHGVSNRLTGNGNGLDALQSEGMGEGWGDWWALMFTQETASEPTDGRGVGTYVLGQPLNGAGIRTFKYDFDITNSSVQTFTAFNAGATEGHASGTLWAAMLWDVNKLLIDKYGFEPNVFNVSSEAGNIRALKLVTNALKIQALNPSFIQARDAILVADQALFGGADLFELWTAFARRGLGQGASTSSSSSSLLTTSFTVPPEVLGINVTGATPAANSVVFSQPTTFTVSFSDPIDSATLQGSDLKVNSIPAKPASLSADLKTATFTYATTPVTEQGTQTMSIVTGSIAKAGDATKTVIGFTATFRYDVLLLQVTSTTPAPEGQFSIPGPITYNVTFNEPISPSSVTTSSLAVSGAPGATVTGATVLVGNMTARFTITGVTAESQLTASIAAGAVTDQFGNSGSAFAANYSVDIATSPFPVPLTAKSPLGSLIYDTVATGVIGISGDTDSFTISVDPNQTLTVQVTPTGAGLQPTVQLLDPTSALIGSASAAAAGQNALLQTIATTSAVTGTYRVVVGGLVGSTGAYTVRLTLNAAQEEEEAIAGVTNNTRATAQDLADSFLNLGGGASRGAVLGAGKASNITDYYSVTLATGDSLNVALKNLTGNGSAVLRLQDTTETVLAAGTGGVTSNFGDGIHDYIALASGTYFIVVTAGSGVNYSLVVTRNIDFDREPNDLSTTAQAIDHQTGALGYSGLGALNRLFTLSASASASVLREINSVTGAVISSFASPVTSSSGLDYGLAMTPYTVLVGGSPSSPIYELNPNTGATIRTIPNPLIAVSGMAFMNNEIYVLTDATSGQITVLDYASGAVKRTITATGVAENLGSSGTALYGAIGSTLYQINPTTGAVISLGSLTGASAIDGLGVLGSELYVSVGSSVRVYNLSTLAFVRELTGSSDLEAIGADGGGNDEDWYSISAQAGDSLILQTSTPSDGSGEFVNVLNPKIELYNPAGALVASDDNSAPDGRNALMSHSALTTGVYRTRVFAATGIGEYRLSVTGASGPLEAFKATAIDPADGTFTLGTPSAITISFSDAVYLPSISASDFLVDGVPASDWIRDDGDTFRFAPPAGLAVGTHTITLAAGSVLDIQQTPLDAFTSTFTVLAAPRVTATSIAPNGVVAPGAISYQVTFSHAMKVSNLTSSDFSLHGNILNVNYSAASFSFNAAGTVLTLNYTNLPEDNYTLTLIAGASGGANFTDTGANALDGEFGGAFPSGNGVAGGNFVIGFAGDLAVEAFTTPLIAKAPVGSLVYDATIARMIAFSGDSDSFTISVDPNQTLTVQVTPTGAGLQPTVQLLDPTSAVIASASAAAAGQSALMQTVATTSATTGTYTIVVGGLTGSTGNYSVLLTLNALQEEEGVLAGVTNNTRATAQDLAASFVSLGGGSRGAVLGSGDIGGTTDYYFLTLSVGESVSLAYKILAGGATTLQVQDAAGTILTTGVGGTTNFDVGVHDFVAPVTGNYYFGIFAGSAIKYSLVVTRNLDFDRDLNDTSATAQSLDHLSGALGYVSHLALNRLFTLDATAGAIREVDPVTGAIIRSFASPTTGPFHFGMATTPTTLLVGGPSSSPIFELDPNTGATIRTIPSPSGGATGMAFMNNEIFVLTDTFAGQITVLDYATGAVKRTITASGITASLGSSGMVLYGANSSPAPVSLRQINPLTGTVTSLGSLTGASTIEGLGVIGSELYVSVGSSIRVYNLSTLAFVRALTGFTNLEAIGADGGGVNDEDWYSVSVQAGDSLMLQTSTPGDGSGESVNVLNPKIELYDPAGVLVDSDDNSAADGRNALLSHTTEATGLYRVRVFTVLGSGEYRLSVTGASGPLPAFQVASITPVNGISSPSVPTSITIDLNDVVYLPSISASDLLVDGVPATSLTQVDNDTFSFTPPAGLGIGTHTVALAAGSVLDIQQTPLDAFTSTFSIFPAPRLTSTSLAPNSAIAPGSLTYEVAFSGPMKVSNLTSDDFSLHGNILNVNYTVASFSFNPAGTVLTLNYASLPEDNYTLTLISGASGGANFTDTAGNALDGEFSGSFPTGDGVAGGNFLIGFVMDFGVEAYPMSLIAEAPVGSLIYDSAIGRMIAFGGDTDGFTISLDAGQTLNVLVTPTAAGLQPTIEVRNSSNTLVAGTTATAAGQRGVLNTIAISGAGTYTVTVAGAAGTTGLYTLHLMLNVALEAESYGGSTNNSRATAQDIFPSFLNLGGGASRGAVLGSGETGGTSDFYSLNLTTGDTLTLAVKNLTGSGATVLLQDASGVVLATGGGVATNFDTSIRNFVVTATGPYYFVVTVTSEVNYSLVATRNVDFNRELNDASVTAQLLDTQTSVLGYVGKTGLGRLFALDAAAVAIREVNPVTGAIIRSFASPVASSPIPDFGMATTGTSLLVGGLPTFPIFELNPDTGATIRTIPNPSIAVSGMAFMNNEIFVLTDSPAGKITVLDYASGAVKRTITVSGAINESLGSSGTALYASNNGTPLFRQIDPLTGVATSFGTFSGASGIQGLGMVGNEVYVAVGTSIRVYNLSNLAFVRTLSGLNNLEAIGADGGTNDEDWYSLPVSGPGVTINLGTSTPFDTSGQIPNILSPHIELLTPTGLVVASGVVGADGRNESLSHVASGAGAYRVRVTAKSSTAGEYVLTSQLVSTPLSTVQSVVIDDGAAQRSRVRSIAVTFNGAVATAPNAAFLLTRSDGLVIPVVASAPMSLGGGLTGVTLTVSGASLEFSSLADGEYTLAIHGSQILDDFGRTVDAAGAGVAGSTKTVSFLRFFGDANGDGVVDATDYLVFRAAVLSGIASGANSAYDYNGDSAFTAADSQAFVDHMRRRVLSAVLPFSATEGEAVHLTGSLGNLGQTDPLTLTIHWGVGESETVILPAGATAFDLTHVYADDSLQLPGGQYQVTVSAANQVLVNSFSVTLPIQVTNLAPIVNSPITAPYLLVGELTSLAGTFTDPGVDPWTGLATIMREGENQGVVAPMTITTLAGAHAYRLDYQFDDPGIYVVQYAINDGTMTSYTSSVVSVVSTVITSASDDGPGSLRQAIVAANLTPSAADTIQFAIPGADLHWIQLASALPALSDPVTLWIPAGKQIEVGSNSSTTLDRYQYLTLNGGGTLVIGGSQSYSLNTMLRVDAGSLIFNSDTGSVGNLNLNLAANGPGAKVTLNSTQHLKSLEVSGGAVITLTTAPGSSLATGDKYLLTNDLSIDSMSTVDIGNGALIVNYTGNASPYAAIRAQAANSFDGGHWDLPGLMSSLAAADASMTGVTTLGVVDNTDLAYDSINGAKFSYDGAGNIPLNSVLVKFTYYGDTDLNGKVTADDLTNFFYGFDGLGPASWVYGDFDYSGDVTADDFTIWAYGFDNQAAPLSTGGGPWELLSGGGAAGAAGPGGAVASTLAPSLIDSVFGRPAVKDQPGIAADDFLDFADNPSEDSSWSDGLDEDLLASLGPKIGAI